jgi:hypothetical protein
MSDINIRDAFEKRLALMTPAISTAFENVSFTPVTNVPYQRAFLLPAQPENESLGDAYYRESGIFQVSLYYPLNVGPQDAEIRAEAIRTHFKRGTSMTEGGQTVLVVRTPQKSPAQRIDDRYFMAISIPYRSEVF